MRKETCPSPRDACRIDIRHRIATATALTKASGLKENQDPLQSFQRGHESLAVRRAVNETTSVRSSHSSLSNRRATVLRQLGAGEWGPRRRRSGP